MTFDVMERMLCYISNTCVRVLLYVTGLRFVFSNKCNTGAQGYLNGDVEKCWGFINWVGESTLAHLHQSLTLGFDTFDRTRLWESELHLGFSKGEVRSGGRFDLNEFVKVTLESVKFQVFNLKDVGTAVIEETGIVGHDDGSDISQGVE